MLKNPMSRWLKKWVEARCQEFKNFDKRLKIGYMSSLKGCKIGRNNILYDNVCLYRCELGDFTYVSSDTVIKRAKIGKFCSIGPNCKIGLGKHPSKDFVSTHPIFYSILEQAQVTFADQNYFKEFADIEIGNDVWIGSNVMVYDGVKVGDGAILAAGSVVVHDVAPYSIVGGVPAKIIRYRFTTEEIATLLKIQWWEKDDKFLKKHYKEFHDIKILTQHMKIF